MKRTYVRAGICVATAALLAGLGAAVEVSIAGAATGGRVIGMASGGGSKNCFALGGGGIPTGGKGVVATLTGDCAISNVQSTGNTLGTVSGGTITASFTSSSKLTCASLTGGTTTWTGSAQVQLINGALGTTDSFTFQKIKLVFQDGVLYGQETGKVAKNSLGLTTESGTYAFSPASSWCGSTATPGSIGYSGFTTIKF